MRLRNVRLNSWVDRLTQRAVDTALSPVLGSIRGADSAHHVAITFDDGPEPTVTPRLLALLREREVHATFFVLLTQCRLHPELLEAMVAGGHEIALHGIDHRPITSLPYAAAIDYLTEARRELAAVTGQRIRLYRPPYGTQSMSSWRAARKAGMDVVVWSSFGPDWVERDVDGIVADSMARLRAGGILLLHERLEPGARKVLPITTFDRVEMTRLLIDRIAEKGWQPTTVGRMVAVAGARRTVWLTAQRQPPPPRERRR